MSQHACARVACKTLFMLIAAILPASTTVLAAAAATNQNLADLARFLDASVPADQRRSLFEGWRTAALSGDADAQYIVGSIYRRGDSIEPHVVGRDADQARRFLSTAAGHGRLLAMAKMAELELSEDRPLEAMIWTQIYGAYRGWVRNENITEYGEHNEREPTLYFEDLLRRVTERMRQKLGSQKSDVVLAQLNAFVAAHDSDVRAGLWRDGIAPHWAGARLKYENARSFRRVQVPIRDMLSEWVLVFGVEGSVKVAEPFDALPNFVKANADHGLVSQYEAARAERGAADRYALKTVDLRKADWPIGPVREH
jgi:hypothetical protein